MKKAALLLLTALIAAGPAIPCGASPGFCSCVESTGPRQALELDDAVFRGVVVEVGRGAPRLREPRFDLTRRIRVRVLERWKGAPGDTVTIYTGAGGPDCGYPFAPGVEYLIYAHSPADSVLTTGICNRTMMASEKGADEEMRELRRLTAAAR